ncbi:MAG: Gx transporter family protein [Clostridiales bacterium]|nr:Gx transporter family protein [Clostridiales bacterium]
MKYKPKRLVSIGALTAVALTIFVIENQIPPLVAIPGIKLGLSNIITLFALVIMGPKDAFTILVLRVTLGSIFSGQIMTLAYSMSGGILCLLAEIILVKLLPLENLWAVSVIGAVIHNITQIAVAALITMTAGVFFYLPYLIIAGIITGTFIGLCVQIVIKKSGNTFRKLLL